MKLSLNRILTIVLGIFWVLLSFQMLTISGWNTGEESALKLYHIFSLVFLIPLIKYPLKLDFKKIGLFYVFFFMLIVVLSAVVLFPFYGFNSMIVNYVFAFYIFFIGYFLIDTIGEIKVLRILQAATVLVNIVVMCKVFYYYEEISFFLKNPYGHPSIYYIYGGGPNLEATWITLNSLFFINKKRNFYLSLLFGLIISIIYASRVSMIMIVLVYFFYFISNRPTKKERKYIIGVTLTSLLFFGYFIIQKLSDLYVIKRFMHIGEKTEGGSQGRMILYNAYIDSFSYKTLFGVGPGNAIPYISKTINKSFLEDNLHNYFLQLFLELGLLGLLFFLLIIIDVVHKNIQLKLNSPLGIFILCYLIGCLIQFRGAESFVWLCLGMFYKSFYKENIN